MHNVQKREGLDLWSVRLRKEIKSISLDRAAVINTVQIRHTAYLSLAACEEPWRGPGAPRNPELW